MGWDGMQACFMYDFLAALKGGWRGGEERGAEGKLLETEPGKDIEVVEDEEEGCRLGEPQEREQRVRDSQTDVR